MYNNYGFNPYIKPPMYQPIDTTQPINTQTYMQPIQANTNQQTLLGKSVDSIDVVKATDIPLDGSTSYFPLTDGSAIVTKKLQADGTSKTTIYRPTQEEQKEVPKYVTIDELKESLSEIDLSDIDDLKDDIKDIKQEIKDLKKAKKKSD